MYGFIYPSIHLFIPLSIMLFMHPSIFPSFYLSLNVFHLSLYLPTFPSLSPSIFSLSSNLGWSPLSSSTVSVG